ncbi:PKD domain-containing protein [Adhaeribacter soli]|uniref:PKD domain-containing protein n=1 Tax=Adhaeribacter soli TaxID=2607655 RepID=A0A5N1IUP6_9BACT|nr:PKD domain-containing protein [Adhaeribacter soli]KAA9333740.1 PKD domain-containing protein [Adhaeribacter soli]
MKLRSLLAASLLGLFLNNAAEAQTQPANGCTTDAYNRALAQKHPATSASSAAIEQQIQQYIRQQANRRKAGPVLKIPVVVHVVTESGCNGISKAQILNGLEVVNQDFRRQNPDTANTRAIFKPYAADTEIEFVLARIGPGGAATEGINRVTSPLANLSHNWDDLKIAVPAWPTDKYLNIWLVESINSNVVPGAHESGYSQFPGVGPWNTYGVVLMHSMWGKQGAVPGSTALNSGREATHHIAHSFHLMHDWGCSNTNGSCSGDLVLDTPPYDPALITSPCNLNQNTCQNDVSCSGFTSDMPDQVENYLYPSAPDCRNMFTQGQKARMQAALNTYPQLQNLISASNAIATGIDPGVTVRPMLPMPYFCVDNRRICEGGSITFTDKSYEAAGTSWYWNFQGGTPATSTAQNPVVTYNTPGKYDVTLSVANADGVMTLSMNDHITVVPTSNRLNISYPHYYVENFEEPTFPESATPNRTWEKSTSSLAANAGNWTQVNTASSGYSGGTNSLRLQNANIPAGTISTLITPNFTFQGGIPSHLGFYYAYAKKNNQPLEELQISASADCGQTWDVPFIRLRGNQLVTNGGTIVPGNYVPASGEWQMESVPFSQALPFGNLPSHIMFKVEAVSNSGGNLYFDHFFMGTVLGVGENLAAKHKISLFPNPLTSETGIAFELKTAEKVAVKVMDVVGNTIYEQQENTFKAGSHTISLAGKLKTAKAGMYLVQMSLGGKVYNTKLLVQ